MAPGSSRGQSGPLGVGLLFAITMIGAVAVVGLGLTAIGGTQQNAEVNHAQQSMTQFDSTASQVALGSSNVRSVSFGGSSGSYSVEPDAGNIRIVHRNYDGSGSDEVVYDGSLGAVVYENGGRTIAYQGGGVWSTAGGGSTMISPPEFHYRGATLTLPIIHVTGDGGAKGNPTATIEIQSSGREIYPSVGGSNPNAPYDGTGAEYENPQKTGKFVVVIESRYYDAWASYFRSRTEGTVSTTDLAGDTGRVTVELISLGVGPGDFDVPGEGGTVELKGLGNGHAISDFQLKLRPTDGDSANFNDLQWSLYAEDGDERFEIHLRDNSGSGCGDTTADVVFYYSDDGGDTYQGWVAEEAFTAKCDGDGDIYFDLDLTSMDAAQEMTYQSLGNDDSVSTSPPNPSRGTLSDPVNINPHGHSSREYQDGDTEEMGFLLRHYIANFGSSIEFEVYDKNGNGGSVGEGPSTGYVDYGGSGQYVTFLHVTENEIEVRFN